MSYLFSPLPKKQKESLPAPKHWNSNFHSRWKMWVDEGQMVEKKVLTMVWTFVIEADSPWMHRRGSYFQFKLLSRQWETFRPWTNKSKTTRRCETSAVRQSRLYMSTSFNRKQTLNLTMNHNEVFKEHSLWENIFTGRVAWRAVTWLSDKQKWIVGNESALKDDSCVPLQVFPSAQISQVCFSNFGLSLLSSILFLFHHDSFQHS